MSSSRKRWSPRELDLLESYIKEKTDCLKNNIYQNILIGKLQYRKNPRFFIKMSQTIGRSPEQCKSKFQKYEEKIYLIHLGVPKKHYEVFLHLRERKKQMAKNQNMHRVSRTRISSKFVKADNSTRGMARERGLGCQEQNLEGPADSSDDAEKKEQRLEMKLREERRNKEMELIRDEIVQLVKQGLIECEIPDTIKG